MNKKNKPKASSWSRSGRGLTNWQKGRGLHDWLRNAHEKGKRLETNGEMDTKWSVLIRNSPTDKEVGV